MRRAHLLLLALAVGGCHEPFSNDDLLFLKAAPRGLRLDVPEEDGSARALRVAQTGEGPAQLYLQTRQAAEQVNEQLLGVLDLVDFVVAFPPSVREEDRRVWGPFPVDNGNELMLVVDRIRTATVVNFTSVDTRTVVTTRDGETVTTTVSRAATADEIYQYSMLGRPVGGGDDDFVLLFGGRSLPQTSLRQGTGLMLLNFDGIKALDPSEEATGQVIVTYDTRFEETVVEVAADAVVMGNFAPDVAWVYHLEASGAGRFVYFLRLNIFETTEALELLGIASRWLPDDRGRADVIVTEGDVPIPFYFASECWDPSFSRVFLSSNIPSPEYSPVGRVELCGPELLTSQFPNDG